MKLNLGCGKNPIPGYINVDINESVNPDMRIDLSKKWPLNSRSVDEIKAYHLVEHLPSFKHFMDEAWRVLTPIGLLNIRVPYYKHKNAFSDPTHVRFFTEESLNYYLLDSNVEKHSDKKWILLSLKHNGQTFPDYHIRKYLKKSWTRNVGELEFILTPLKE